MATGGVPVAMVSLVDDHRQFFKSQHGLPEPWASRRETPLSHSFCQHVVSHAAPLIVSDAREHPLVRDNPAINEMGVVAYAGIPIQASNGQVLGSFCAIDTLPHAWTESEIDTLRQLGELLRTELQLREALWDVRMALPLLGDACVVHLRDESGSHESICRHVDPSQEARLCELPGDQAIAPGMPAERDVGVIEPAPGLLAELGMTSVVTAPLRGQQGRIGTLLFASGKRDHDSADLWLAEEIARRVSSAIDNATLYRAARAATRARDEVLAVVSHDLRNPVHTIQMSASLLLELLEEEPIVDPVLFAGQIGAMRRSALRADRLIRDLMDVTRAERGRLDIERRPVIVNDLLRDASQGIASQAQQRGLSIDVQPTDNSVRVTGDRDRLLQALDNLLSNAVKFTPSGGLVTLSATADEQDVCFVVQDTGPGMTIEQQSNLFTQFWQARRGDRRGVGLGLTIVKGIVDAHEGTVTVESEPACGSTFRIRMPRDTSNESGVEEQGMLMGAS